MVDLLRRNSTIVIGLIAGIVMAIFLWRVVDDLRAPEIVIVDPFNDQEIVVEVSGAVQRPGVYTLPATARVTDAVDAAGGASVDADIAQINLAARLSDADQVFIPAAVAHVEEPPALAAPRDPPKSEDVVRFLNGASGAELEELPGIGPVLAGRIIEARSENGPFVTLDDVVAIDGVSAAMVEELTQFLSGDQ